MAKMALDYLIALASSIILQRLRPSTLEDDSNLFDTREMGLQDMLHAIMQSHFQKENGLAVRFLGEQGIDGGALSDSLLNVCIKDLSSLPIFTEEE